MISKHTRKAVKRKCFGRCAYCGFDCLKLTLDHVNPVFLGGLDDLNNLLPSCSVCNAAKRNMKLRKFRRLLQFPTHWNSKWGYRTIFRLSVRYMGFSGLFYYERESNYLMAMRKAEIELIKLTRKICHTKA